MFDEDVSRMTSFLSTVSPMGGGDGPEVEVAVLLVNIISS
jgi:hypothetical protein